MTPSPNQTSFTPWLEQAHEAAEQMGTGVPKVSQIVVDFRKLQEQGVFGDVTATLLSPQRLAWTTLGIEAPKDMQMRLYEAASTMIPAKYMRSLHRAVSRARQALYDHSFQFSATEALFGSNAWRFIPWTAWPSFKKEMLAAREDMVIALATVEHDWPEIEQIVKNETAKLAADAVKRLKAVKTKLPKGYKSWAAWEEAARVRLFEITPQPEHLRARCTLRFRPGAIRFASEVLEEQRRAIEAQAAVYQAEAALAVGQAKLQSDLMAVEAESEIKAELRKLEFEAAKEYIDAVAAPHAEAALAVFDQMAELAREVLDSLSKSKGKLYGATAASARQTVERFGKLSGWLAGSGIPSLDDLIALTAELDAEVKPWTEKAPRPTEALTGILESMRDLCDDAKNTLQRQLEEAA